MAKNKQHDIKLTIHIEAASSLSKSDTEDRIVDVINQRFPKVDGIKIGEIRIFHEGED
jgi:hypothetical protein